MQNFHLKIGTRGSVLALAQAHEVRQRLCDAHGFNLDDILIEVIKTTGDQILDRPLSEVGGKGLFTKEIEEALLDGRIDLAVHSSKDMPTLLPNGLHLTTFLEREDMRDALISPHFSSIEELPQGACFGTASLRRQALVRRMRPDLDVVTFRGNVQTRLKKLQNGDVSATLLANAGLRRLGLEHEIAQLIDLEKFPPAPGQGAICIEARIDDDRVAQLLKPLDHQDTHDALLCERAFLASLDGSCRTPLAAYATLSGDNIALYGMILTPDGQSVHEDRLQGDRSKGAEIGTQLGALLRERAGTQFFESWT